MIYSNRSIFVKNSDEVINIFDSAFSIATQEKYTGKFVFQKFETIEIYSRKNGMENEIDREEKERIEQKAIVVDIDENGYLFVVSGIPGATDDTTDGKFFIKDNRRLIYSYRGDRTFRSRIDEYYFFDEDTIINEYEYYSGDESGPIYVIKFKVKYIRTNEY